MKLTDLPVMYAPLLPVGAALLGMVDGEWVCVKGLRKEPHMGTFAYEVVVPRKVDEYTDTDETERARVSRPFKVIAYKSGLEHKPTREQLLVQYATDIEKALNGCLSDIGDVQIVIGPTVGPFGQ